jgi:hypothetical protein
MTGVLHQNLRGLKSYLKSNPGALFVVAFQALLLAAAVLLGLGNSPLANEIALYAFYVLATGVAFQVYVTVREERKHARTNHGR